MKEQKANELDVLLPETAVKINGELIEIKPFPFAKLPRVITLLGGIGVGLFELFKTDNGMNFGNGSFAVNDTWLIKLSEVVEDHFAEVAELMGIYCNKPVEFFMNEESGLSGEDGLVLLLSIIERNYGFFMRRLAPILNQLKEQEKK